eukprot:6212906-Pleurochrysis_carterae.AAC.1
MARLVHSILESQHPQEVLQRTARSLRREQMKRQSCTSHACAATSQTRLLEHQQVKRATNLPGYYDAARQDKAKRAK